jgi:GNAT superfamily N-acetyltransferase
MRVSGSLDVSEPATPHGRRVCAAEWDTSRVINDPPRASIRVARPDEFAALRHIEFAADRIYESVGIGPFTNDDSEDHFGEAVLVLVAGEPPVGFVCVELVDGTPHVWQLSVLPDHARRGLGRSLMNAVVAWTRSEGFGSLTLTTFRDVPWNGPFYESLGFVVEVDLSPGLRAIREHERAIGDDDYGPRVAMRLPFPSR